MKQKRKVKSLISSNDCRTINGNDVITSLLLVLGGALLLGSISLFEANSVNAAGGKLAPQTYSGVTNKVETIYRATFLDENNKDVVGNMYVDKGSNGSDFYIETNSVVLGNVNKGEGIILTDTAYKVGSNTSSSVLGGKVGKLGEYDTALNSSNITLIGGSESNISRGNDNAALLGGSEIRIGQGSSGIPLVVIGGIRNEMEGEQNGNSLVGGSGNIVGSNNTNVHVLGGENNVVAGNNNNVIVAGEGVHVDSDVNNVFAFSADSSQFFPKSSNAFYLDVSGGLGLDKNAEDGKVSSNGAVSMGELTDEDLKGCKRDLDGFVIENLGVQGTISGCVVGCTSRSVSDSKWELLDKSEYCVDVCESTYDCNIYPDTDGTKGGEDHEYAYCTGIDIRDSWWNGRITQCGGDGAEKKYEDVVFKTKIIDVDGTCPGDMTPKGENQCVFKCNPGYHLVDGKCYKDCTRDGRTIKHKESDYWNPSNQETCPTECGYTKALLTCNDGTLYNGSSVDTTHMVYQNNCTTQPLPSPSDYNRSSAVSNAECLSFQPYKVNDNACVALPKTYKCTNCNEHYTLNSSNLDILPNGDTSAQCLQDCPFIAGPSRNTIYLSGWTGSPNSSIVAYKAGLYVCPAMGTSESQIRQCNDGYLNGSYRYISYTQEGVVCEDTNSGLTRTLSSQIDNATLVSPSYCVEYQDDTCENLGTKYYYQCDNTYGWNPAGTKCVKCTGNPSNAVRNNYSMPDDTMELYFDDVNTSDPCTFSCAEGAYYDASLGVCVGYTCDGVAHGETRTLTRDKTPACPTECDEITATCYSGIWYNNGTAVTDYSLGTCTTSGKTCPVDDSGNIKWFNASAGSKTGAALVDTCTEYSSNGKGCTAGSTYKSWLCDGTNYWNGDNCKPVCVNNACADGFTAYGIAGNTSYVCRKGVSNTVSCSCGAGKKWSSDAGACVDDTGDFDCDTDVVYGCINSTAKNKNELTTKYIWDCENEFGEIMQGCTIYKCTGTAPSSDTHTVANNGNYPTSSTAWHYSTNTSEACSYRCDDGFDRVHNDVTGEDDCRKVHHWEWRFSNYKYSDNPTFIEQITETYESTSRSPGGCVRPWPWSPNDEGTIRAQVNAVYLTKGRLYESRNYYYTNYQTGRDETTYWNNCNNWNLSEVNTATRDEFKSKFKYQTSNNGNYGVNLTIGLSQFEMGFYAIDQSALSLATVPGIRYYTPFGDEVLEVDYGTTPTMKYYDVNDYKNKDKSDWPEISVGAFPVYIHVDWNDYYSQTNPYHENDRHAHGGANIIGSSFYAIPTKIYYARCGTQKHGWTKTEGGCQYVCNDGSWQKTNPNCGSSNNNNNNNNNNSCFIAGTKVTMADGSKKNIEDVQVGDLLLGETSINEVEELYRPLLGEQKLFSINGGESFVTAEHPFKTTMGWRSMDPVSSMKLMDGQVDLLKVGDILVTENGYEKITSLVGVSAPEDTQLYNFKVGGDDTYYADGYLVHNKGCFLAGTKVYMADGTTKNIEDVEAGDMVMTYNTASGKIEYHRVLRPLVHENNNDELYELTINGEVLKVTEVHRFYVSRDRGVSVDNQCANPYEWIEARYLQVGDKILMNDGTQAEIEDITHHSNYGTVYNLWVEGMHNYYVDKGYLVHNAAKEKATTDLNDGPDSSNNNRDCGGPGKPDCTTMMY